MHFFAPSDSRFSNSCISAKYDMHWQLCMSIKTYWIHTTCCCCCYCCCCFNVKPEPRLHSKMHHYWFSGAHPTTQTVNTHVKHFFLKMTINYNFQMLSVFFYVFSLVSLREPVRVTSSIRLRIFSSSSLSNKYIEFMIHFVRYFFIGFMRKHTQLSHDFILLFPFNIAHTFGLHIQLFT